MAGMHPAVYYPHPHGPRPSALARQEDENGAYILCMVDDIMYPITEEALDTVLSAYGEVVQKAIYERPGIWQAVVQYSSPASANAAKQALEGHAIYEGGYNKLRVFNSSKRALLFVNAAVSMPEYSMSDRELEGIRAVVNGDDYFRAHNDIGRAAIAVMTGLPLPLSFVPTSIPSAGLRQSVGAVPVGSPHVFLHPVDPYMNGPPPGHYFQQPAFHQMQSAVGYHRDSRYSRPMPMTTYPPMLHPMQNHHSSGRNSYGLASGESERQKHV